MTQAFVQRPAAACPGSFLLLPFWIPRGVADNGAALLSAAKNKSEAHTEAPEDAKTATLGAGSQEGTQPRKGWQAREHSTWREEAASSMSQLSSAQLPGLNAGRGNVLSRQLFNAALQFVVLQSEQHLKESLESWDAKKARKVSQGSRLICWLGRLGVDGSTLGGHLSLRALTTGFRGAKTARTYTLRIALANIGLGAEKGRSSQGRCLVPSALQAMRTILAASVLAPDTQQTRQIFSFELRFAHRRVKLKEAGAADLRSFLLPSPKPGRSRGNCEQRDVLTTRHAGPTAALKGWELSAPVLPKTETKCRASDRAWLGLRQVLGRGERHATLGPQGDAVAAEGVGFRREEEQRGAGRSPRSAERGSEAYRIFVPRSVELVQSGICRRRDARRHRVRTSTFPDLPTNLDNHESELASRSYQRANLAEQRRFQK
ncbi:unnamed protein product [Symbiodinium microadriaticum]|nr:unnamed protein product [Symbiodinium microadriaticum]CAE7948293.1 unnamed protein product [Symbiodinium sp. KB8]